MSHRRPITDNMETEHEHEDDHGREEQEEVPFEMDADESLVSSARLEMFSDAVWAIIATIMIVPTMHNSISEQLENASTQINVSTIVDETVPGVGLYVLAFTMVCSIWASHVWIFQTMKYVTDFSICINLVVLLIGSAMPYFYSLLARYRTKKPLIIFCSLEIAIGILQLVIVLHAFAYPNLLASAVREIPPADKKDCKKWLVKSITSTPIIAFLSICISFGSVNAAIVCLAIIPLFPRIRFLLAKVTRRSKILTSVFTSRRRIPNRLLTKRIKKDRIEAFNDGVCAITATLLVLDISEEYLPKSKNDAMTDEELNELGIAFLIYMLAFVVIGHMWYSQLLLIRAFRAIAGTMMFLNHFVLSCVGMIPLAFTFILRYKIPSALTVGVRFACIIVICAAAFRVLLYLLTMFIEKRTKQVWIAKSLRRGGDDFAYSLYQVITPVVLSLIVLIVSFAEAEGSDAPALLGVSFIAAYTISLFCWRIAQSFIKKKQPNLGADSVNSDDRESVELPNVQETEENSPTA